MEEEGSEMVEEGNKSGSVKFDRAVIAFFSSFKPSISHLMPSHRGERRLW